MKVKSCKKKLHIKKLACKETEIEIEIEIEIDGQNMFWEWTETDKLPHLIIKFQPCGKRNQG